MLQIQKRISGSLKFVKFSMKIKYLLIFNIILSSNTPQPYGKKSPKSGLTQYFLVDSLGSLSLNFLFVCVFVADQWCAVVFLPEVWPLFSAIPTSVCVQQSQLGVRGLGQQSL